MIRLQIMGETPAKKNSKVITKSGAIIPSERYREWHKSAMQQIDAQCHVVTPIEKECCIKMVFYHGDKRRRDSDNGASSILDLLCDSRILSDDKWEIVRKLQIENEYDKNMARCIIEISPYDLEL